jgi:hypothetical protein
MADKTRGIYDKFVVLRTDGQSAVGRKHHGCPYFVLDGRHDPFAPAAMMAYAEACEETHPLLAKDLQEWVRYIKECEGAC